MSGPNPDETTLRQSADRIYRRARSVVAVTLTLGASGGAAAGWMIAAYLATFGTPTDPGLWAIAGGLVGGLAGVSFGESRAVALRGRAEALPMLMRLDRRPRGASI